MIAQIKKSIFLILLLCTINHVTGQGTQRLVIDPESVQINNLIDNFSIKKIVRLETGIENILNYIYYLEIENKRIYISNYYGCFVYTLEGKYLGKSFDIGRGPGELILPRGLTLSPNSDEFSVYDNMGRYIAVFTEVDEFKTRKYPKLHFISDLYWLSNNKYLLFSYLPQNDSDKEGRNDYCVFEYDPGTNKKRGVLHMPNNYNALSIKYHTTFSYYKEHYYVIIVFDNNVYDYHENDLMKAKYNIDFGKFNTPDELLNGKLVDTRVLMGKIQKGKFAVVVDFQELEDHFVVIYDKYPDRYTTLISKRDGSQVTHSFRNEDDVLSRATPFFEHDGYMIASLQPSSFLKKYNSINKSTLSDYERKIYAEIAEGMNESDNPVLLFLKPR